MGADKKDPVSSLATNQVRSRVVTTTTEQNTQGPVTRASPADFQTV